MKKSKSKKTKKTSKKEETGKSYSSVEDMCEDLGLNKKWHWYNHTYWWIRYGIWQKISDFPREVYWFIQRGKRGYSDSDTWGFNYHLSDIITGGIKHLRKNLHGCPDTLNPKTGKHDFNIKRWGKILDEIVYTFETGKNVTCSNWLYINTNKWNKKEYNRMVIICKEMNAKWPEEKYKALTKKECKRYEDGWKLFQEYFFNLWD